jgi:toxin-antitoxin system PIN domain toxin
VIVVDTNLLVYAHRSATPEHPAARSALEAASRLTDGWGLATASVLEFWSVVTHPAATGRPSTAREARAFIDALVAAGARLLAPGPAVAQRILEAADRLQVVGPRVFDLHIAVTALDHGATELWSHDGGFITLPGLRLVDPLAA